jgi:predicted lipoprotein with Yx(FWY)xxD motif
MIWAMTYALAAVVPGPAAEAQREKKPEAGVEAYMPEAMPPGFGVSVNELEGPVFVNSKGMALYRWPLKGLRNGDVGDRKNAPSNCTSEVYTENSGLMSPYPPGLTLPDAGARRSCAEVWPAVLAAKNAAPVGKWTVVDRRDGSKQWAYDGYPVYTSDLDLKPGDVLGATHRNAEYDGPGVREPVGPRANVPPSFEVKQVATGRMLVSYTGFSVYAWDRDEPNKSLCTDACLAKWSPVLAAETSQPQGDWSIVQRSPGVRQWAFRKKPLYTYVDDPRPRSLVGSDEPGWHNVYTQPTPAWPGDFTVQDGHLGRILADAGGKTIYFYNCGDDALDQLACDHPAAPQAYRLAVCGGGDAARCLRTWRPLIASRDARAVNRTWTTIDIDPLSGHFASPGQAGALHVWAFRGRPVYTFVGDKQPGDVEGDAWGEFLGYRNGFKAFWLRDDFYDNAE